MLLPVFSDLLMRLRHQQLHVFCIPYKTTAEQIYRQSIGNPL